MGRVVNSNRRFRLLSLSLSPLLRKSSSSELLKSSYSTCSFTVSRLVAVSAETMAVVVRAPNKLSACGWAEKPFAPFLFSLAANSSAKSGFDE